MPRSCFQRRCAAVVLATAVCAGLSGGTAARATELDMAELPVVSPFLCLSCHTRAEPAGGDLNAFGTDFLDNSRIWDEYLAQLDSDGDGCLNGAEIGDVDGNGQADGNVTEQAGNPGVADDCGSGNLVDEQTWGALKAIFDGR